MESADTRPRPALWHQMKHSLTRAWRALSSWFKQTNGRRRFPEALFAPIDVDALKQRLRLAEQAYRFGKAGLPASDAQNLDGPQRQIAQSLRAELTDAFQQTNTRFAKLWSALRARDVTELVRNIKTLPARVRQELEAERNDLEAELETVRRGRDRIQHDLEEYRARYGLREPELKSRSDRQNVLAVTIIVALAQSVANTAFFAQGATYGISAGLLAAVVLGVADIVFHLHGGRWASMAVAPEWWRRAAGGALALLLIASVVLWNLGIVHLRNGVRLHGFEAGSEQWLDSMMTSLFGFNDFYSWALFLIGLVCSSLAVVAGLSWDEPVPRLRGLGRRLEEANADLHDAGSRLQELKAEGDVEIWSRLETERARIRHNVNISDQLYRDIHTTHDNLLAHVAATRDAFMALIQFYRDENVIARPRDAKPPAYFQQIPTFDTTIPLEVNIVEMRQFVEEQHALASSVGLGGPDTGFYERELPSPIS
jgi:hypothetical protein